MSIHPRFAQAILDGRKLVEFRKRAFRTRVARVLIYETAPTSMVVGYFTLADSCEASPAELWRKHGAVGGIDKTAFGAYFGRATRGVGLVVGGAVRFRTPMPLPKLLGLVHPPQSFQYVDWSPNSRDTEMAKGHPAPAIRRKKGWTKYRLKVGPKGLAP